MLLLAIKNQENPKLGIQNIEKGIENIEFIEYQGKKVQDTKIIKKMIKYF